MSELPDLLHRALRYSHITCAFAGLVLFWIPIFAAKGGRLHIRVGTIFKFLAYYVGVTGLISSIWCLVHTPSFVGAEWRTVSESAAPYLLEKMRFLFSILGFLSLGVVSGMLFGIRSVRTRHDHSALSSPWLLFWLGAFGLWSIGLTIFGIWNLVLMYMGRHLLPVAAAGRYLIPIVLGSIGVFGAFGDLSYIRSPRPSPMAWWYTHMENMLGVGIGFHTAFMVFGAFRFLPIELAGAWQLLPWLLPSVIGIPASHFWIRYYKRRFSELPSAPSAEQPQAANARPS